MDIAAHVIWSLVLLPGEPSAEKIIFGILPDISVFIPDLIVTIIRKEKRNFKTREEMMKWYDLPQNRWKKKWYQWTHSSFFWILIILPILFFQKSQSNQLSLFLLAPLLHILMDIPTHTHDSFPVTFMYPISKFTVNGIHWSNRWMIIANYSLMIVFFYLRLLFFPNY